MDADRELRPTDKWMARIASAMRRGEFPRVRVSQRYDIPYLGGYSQDGKTIYLDHRVPDRILVGGVRFAPRPFLVIHERVEKWFLTVYHSPYQRAHKIATAVEHQAVREAGALPMDYEAALKPYIRECDDETVHHVPTDLDLTPYTDEDDQRVLQELMRAEAELSRHRPY